MNNIVGRLFVKPKELVVIYVGNFVIVLYIYLF